MRATGNNIEIRVNGVTICYDDLGKDTMPIIFIHGFPFDKNMWKPQVDFFKTSHRVITYDIRGYGKSFIDREKASITLFADDLVKLMDGLQVDKAIICGLSMGGYISLNAVNRFPERFHAIILSDTQCISDTPETRQKRFKTIDQIESGGLSDFADAFIKNIFCKESLSEKKEIVDRIKNTILSTSPETLTGTLTALAERWESCSSLDFISVPALILCGREDIITPPIQSEFLNLNIKNSTLHIIDNAGHMSNIEQPDTFNKHLEDFISGL